MKKSIDKAALYMIYLLSNRDGVLAQLGEHLLCTQGVIGSIPIRSTMIDQKRFLTESFFVLIICRKPHSLANRIQLFTISSYIYDFVSVHQTQIHAPTQTRIEYSLCADEYGKHPPS